MSSPNSLPGARELPASPTPWNDASAHRDVEVVHTSDTHDLSEPSRQDLLPLYLTPVSGIVPSPSSATPSTPNSRTRKPSEAGLHLQTDISTSSPRFTIYAPDPALPAISQPVKIEPPSQWTLQHTRSFDSLASVTSTTSSLPSPALAALTDVTPLPSPLALAGTPELWRKLVGRPHSTSNASIASLAREEMGGYLSPSSLSTSPSKKKKSYAGLGITGTNTLDRSEFHPPNRAISEYVPDPLVNIRPRTVTTWGSSHLQKIHTEHGVPLEQQMHREEYLARQRGLVELSKKDAAQELPTPPLSNRSASYEVEEDTKAGQAEFSDLLTVRDVTTNVKQYWRPLRRIGQGAFSEVFLAKRELPSCPELVAIKIVSHIPTPRNDEERVETSIKREIEILESISHPCLPQLKAYEEDEKRALLVLNYCAGGDLFELASQRRELLTSTLVQRVFAELVAAVGYLHSQMIVHRDIKLENVLFNIPAAQLSSLPDPLSSYPHPLITLTDLGLSKRIPPPPSSPLLTHACGSADYAAPELLLGQPYDGRLTDAWALGVLLYALMEARLPFDPLPVSEAMSPVEQRRRRRNQHQSVKHRIARCDWVWCELGDEEGEWVGRRGQPGLDDARTVVEGCLKKVGRGRWTVVKCLEAAWVQGALQIEGGLRKNT